MATVPINTDSSPGVVLELLYSLKVRDAMTSAVVSALPSTRLREIQLLMRDRAMQEGFSTANEWVRSLGFGAGMGLPNVERVADEFSIRSEVGEGTLVQASIYWKMN